MFSFDELLVILADIVVSHNGQKFSQCSDVFIDSRQLNDRGLFIALKGPHFDGHDFIQDVILKGASVVIVDKASEVSLSCSMIQVENTYEALYKLAHAHRMKMNAKIVAITGSSGKTTVKELMAHVGQCLSQEVVFTHLNQNNEIGVALTLLSIKKNTSLAIVEAGISHVNEMKQLSWMIHPDCIILTNIHAAHIEGLGSVDCICDEKLNLLSHSAADAVLIYDASDESLQKKVKLIDRQCIGICLDPDNLVREDWPDHMNQNALFALTLFEYLKFSVDLVKQSIFSFKGVPGRFFVESLVEGWICIDDAYNANPGSFFAGLDALQRFSYQRLILLVGDMKELGSETEHWHEVLAQKILALRPDRVFAIGASCAMMKTFLGNNKSFLLKGVCMSFEDVESFLASNLYRPQKGDLFYAKGSRAMHLDRAVDYFKRRDF